MHFLRSGNQASRSLQLFSDRSLVGGVAGLSTLSMGLFCAHFNHSASVQNIPWMLNKEIKPDPGVRNGLLKKKEQGRWRVPERS